ncbi:hypothetical protein ACFVXY_06360, partial [Streptomyces virginiae]
MDRPDVVLAAFERGEPRVGEAVIGLALHHEDPAAVLPMVARALESAGPGRSPTAGVSPGQQGRGYPTRVPRGRGEGGEGPPAH